MKTRLSILLLWWLLAILPRPTLALQQANRIGRIQDVIERWTPDQHLYVKGDLGIDAARYAELEQWLDEHGPHWTVVLLQSAENEQYRAANGNAYTGMDAVEYALGYGLANRTGFGQLEHPQTHETDGAVFVLFLTERKFSYYASEAQDRRALGEARWQGELDQPAFRAMRGGGRILDAVKDTVTSINTRLQRSIEAEVEAQVRSQRERERALADLQVTLQHTRDAVQTVTQKAEAFRTDQPQAQGPLTEPPVDEWNRRLQAVEQEVTEDNVRASGQQANELMAEVDRYLNMFALSEGFEARRTELSGQVEQLRAELGGVAAQQADQAGTEIEQAIAARQQGDPTFVEQLRTAEQTLQSGFQLVQQEQARRVRAAARRQLIWNTVLVTLTITTLALIGFLYWLNRRRAPVRAKARQAFLDRQKSVRAEMDRVLQLFDRSREILGPKEKIAARGYDGTTEQLSDEAFAKIDELLIMSNEVDRVMDEVQELIEPHGVVAKVQNQFSATRYERGMNRISGEPLTFHDDQGIPAILAAGQKDEHGQPVDHVSLTFEEVFTAFHQRSEEVTHALDVIESSLLQVNDGLTQLQQRIDEATQIDKQLAAAAEEDGFFHVPKFFDVLLPSAEADHDQADDIAPADPVQAIQQHVPRGLRKADEALQIAHALQHAREHTFPQFDEHAPRLKKRGYETEWIQASVHQLGARADELFALAAERSVAAEAAELDQSLQTLGVRVAQCGGSCRAAAARGGAGIGQGAGQYPVGTRTDLARIGLAAGADPARSPGGSRRPRECCPPAIGRRTSRTATRRS